ncbi:MAG: DHH family phosphoesterase [Deltaproteobacteria bacterium]|nr:DHH family phosphoesterase [Deltaproteobacteria bacterium]
MKRIESLLIKGETLSNVKKLKAMAKETDSFAVLIFGSPDPDAIASGMALREIIRKNGALVNCDFIATEPVTRQQNIEFMRAMKVQIKLLHTVDLKSYCLIAVVDAQPSFFNSHLNGIKPRIVLDHHPKKNGCDAELVDIRDHYGALSTMMTEYLLAAKIKIPRKLSTALLYGIKSDTNNFERDTIIEDVSAYRLNYRHANRQLIRRIELNQIPNPYLKYYDHAFHHRRRYRDRITCFLGKVESPDACVQVADFFLHFIDIYYVVIAGIVKDRLIITFRGDGYRQDCGAIAAKAFERYGSAGGHKSAARVEIPLETLREIIGDDFSQGAVDHFLLNRLRRKRGDTTNGKKNG